MPRNLKFRGENKTVYSASPVHNGEVSFKELKDEVAEITSLGRGDCNNAITTFTELITKHLSSGRIVSLGEFGRFRITMESRSAEKAEEFKASNISRIAVVYTPGVDIRRRLKFAGVELVDPCGSPSGTCKPNGKDSLEEQPS